MAQRLSKADAIRMQNVAEREVMRYAGDHALWHKHVHDVELDPVQVLKCMEMDEHLETVDCSCRRTGKTAVKELYLLKHNATEPDQELGIVAPREAQSLTNLGYHLDSIRRSEILTAWLDHRNGRRQISDTAYAFANRSKAKAYGIMAQVDGGDLTSASLEEVDDMPSDRLYSRFLLMMGSTRRLGASTEAKNEPQIRITGVFKGADTLSTMIESGGYHLLPTVDVHLGIELGILNEQFMEQMRERLSPDEYIRQLLCRNVSARNLIWEKYVRLAVHKGLQAGIEIQEPVPGDQYRKRGLVAFGYDAGGHGEDPQASRHALVVEEMIGSHVCTIFTRTWPPGADDSVVRRDLLSYWRYFMPDCGMGDAYGVGMLTELNDDLFREGLTTIDRRAIGDGDSTASTWPEWAFSPIRFEGMTKHQMAQAVRALFHNRHAALPYVDDLPDSDPAVSDMRLLQRQLPNIKPEETKASYSSYKMADKKVGDDLFDAKMAAVWALVTRGAAPAPGNVITRTRTRSELLGAPSIRLPSDPVGMH
ncbi:hypothetical protein H0Z60_14785 [Ectothiorhodospiraceae bacterium WFHF3C12]|nr:hypothetical protein [Ectothiorhodospiraceae bacterium WFHF3C12]